MEKRQFSLIQIKPDDIFVIENGKAIGRATDPLGVIQIIAKALDNACEVKHEKYPGDALYGLLSPRDS